MPIAIGRRTLEASLLVIGTVVMVASCSGSEGTSGGGAAGASGSVAGTSSSGGSHAAGGAHSASGAGGKLGTGGGAGDSGGASDGGSGGDSEGGAPPEGGAAGADAGRGGEAGSAIVTHDCNDGNANTVDFYKSAYGCGHVVDANPNDGQSWINFDAGFSVDPKTSTAWYYVASAGNVTQTQAAAVCASLGIGTIGFRLPTIDDARAIGYRCPATVSGGSCPIHDPSCLTQACGYGVTAECESCQGGTGNHYVNPDASPFNSLGYHTSSMCTDCTGVKQEWAYGIFNGNFFLQDANQPWSAVCVISDLPDALP